MKYKIFVILSLIPWVTTIVLAFVFKIWWLPLTTIAIFGIETYIAYMLGWIDSDDMENSGVFAIVYFFTIIGCLAYGGNLHSWNSWLICAILFGSIVGLTAIGCLVYIIISKISEREKKDKPKKPESLDKDSKTRKRWNITHLILGLIGAVGTIFSITVWLITK